MQIIIVGCGKVGTALAAKLSVEDHNITVVDTDSGVVQMVANTYDVQGIVGRRQLQYLGGSRIGSNGPAHRGD